MYKVLVVEDEAIIRKGLINSIDWESIDCKVVGEASNGQQALSLIETLKPDIMILDVNMPIMTGIELLETLPQDLVVTIIISGHSEFEYAKKAIKYGVVEYILKPIEEDTIYKALEKAKQTIAMRRSFTEEPKEYKLLPTITIDSLTLLKSIEYIDENIDQKITMGDLEEVTQKSSTSINKRFNDHYGLTFNKFLVKYRMEKAIEYISTLEYQLYEVAEMVGYNDYKYFNQVFNRIVKESPSIVELYYLRNKQGKQ